MWGVRLGAYDQEAPSGVICHTGSSTETTENDHEAPATLSASLVGGVAATDAAKREADVTAAAMATAIRREVLPAVGAGICAISVCLGYA